MPVTRLTLEALLGQVEIMSAEAFVAANPGIFLVAMGRLSAEEVRFHRAAEEDATVPVRVGASHDLRRAHPLAGQVFQLTSGPGAPAPIRLGRGQSCDIQVPDESVSDQHLQLEMQEGRLTVMDLGSTNGTSIGGVRIQQNTPEPVSDGDLLTVARYSFQVLTPGALRATLVAMRGTPMDLG